MQARRLFSILFSRRVLLWVGILGSLLALVGIFAGPHAWACYQLWAAQSDLARYHPETATSRLALCLAVWPDSAEAHLLASRAARQSGDFEDATRELQACQRLPGHNANEVALEWALLQAAGGNLREVEEFLQHQIDQDPRLSPLVWEALAEGYIRVYRILDALACLDHWVSLEPNNLRALELRGLAYQTGKSARKGAEDFRRALQFDPDRSMTRWRLVLCLLDMGSYDEALPLLQRLAKEKPGDPEVQVRLARCHNMLGDRDQARQLLDAVLEAHPDHGLALRTRGQFALADARPDQAEEWLRRGVQVWPNDYQTNWLLFQALEQQKKTTESQAQLRVAEEVKDRAERLGELRSRKLSEQPLDPALHYEMGMLLIRSGRDSAGVAWLLSALDLDPHYQPAHAALADYYEQQGDSKQAAEHRRQSQ